MHTETSISAKLYPDQLEVWEEIRGNRSNADALRDIIRFYCDSRGIDFPLYKTGGRGGKRRGKNKFEVIPQV